MALKNHSTHPARFGEMRQIDRVNRPGTAVRIAMYVNVDDAVEARLGYSQSGKGP